MAEAPEPLPPEEARELDRLVREAALRLAEHADSVRIFVTKRSENGKDGTLRMSLGEGNWFAQYGQIRLWVRAEENRAGTEGEDT